MANYFVCSGFSFFLQLWEDNTLRISRKERLVEKKSNPKLLSWVSHCCRIGSISSQNVSIELSDPFPSSSLDFGSSSANVFNFSFFRTSLVRVSYWNGFLQVFFGVWCQCLVLSSSWAKRDPATDWFRFRFDNDQWNASISWFLRYCDATQHHFSSDWNNLHLSPKERALPLHFSVNQGCKKRSDW